MAKRYCEKCGNELKKDLKFCTSCGTKIEEIKNEKVQEKDKTTKEPVENTIEKQEKNKIEEKKETESQEIIEPITKKHENKEKSNDVIVPIVEKPKKKKGKALKILLIILLVLLLIGGITLLLISLLSGSDDSEDNKKDDTKIEDIEEPAEPFYGNLYEFNDNYAWVKDDDYYYLINNKGKSVVKIEWNTYSVNPIFKDGYGQLSDVIYDNKGTKVLSKTEEYLAMNYVGEGFVIVQIKEENYKGSFIKMGIYDLNEKEYVYPLSEKVFNIFYLEEGMFTIVYNEENNNETFVYNASTKDSFSIQRFDTLTGVYKDGYIVYREINSDEVYLLEKDGTKHLVYKNDRFVNLGQYNDGLIFIKDAFYDVDGKKVIDLAEEGVSNAPEFKNGYALVYFNTGYFAILSRETGDYTFTPRVYTKMGNYYRDDDFTLGIYENQTQISDTGHIIVKVNNDGKSNWAVMDVNGKIVTNLPVGAYIGTGISKDGYIGVTGSGKSYYLNVDGKTLDIDVYKKTK